MGKIKNWTKIRDYMWRKDTPFLGIYQYIWIDKLNRVRRADALKSDSYRTLSQRSYVLKQATSKKNAKEYVIDYMRKVK